MPKQDLQVFKYLKYIKVLKILLLENILICDKKLIFILESTTLISVELSNFIYIFNDELFSKNDTLNYNLKIFKLKNSKFWIEPNLIIFNGHIASENCHSEKFLPNFDFVNQKATTKIFLKNLEITAYFLNNTRIEYYMSFFSGIYDFSKLNSISLNVHKLTDIDYEFFYQMKKLKVIKIHLKSNTDKIDLKNFLKIPIYSIHITPEDIQILNSLKNLLYFTLSTDKIDYKTNRNMRRKNFKTSKFVLLKPCRILRSTIINVHLNSEFRSDFN
ncbi:hypothetical protein CWI38_0027p0020 [Hamiltosporidium tvaerminnensis]|uniref:Uncharacterized protein n=1 Tax=Hamiltosporidium tvaerminnensis TaxID=1176355 RepID=A0A4Q9M4Q8_9MICR|nr:hypothetical protein CWI38_0027p0020 [Hamiltosporidium tvaerminnensis]